MDRRPQSWPSGNTSPRPIPFSSPRLSAANSAVHSEWQKLRFHQERRNQFGFAPRNLSRPHTPPSLSPSPAPSQCSYYTDYCTDELEIEEIVEDDQSGDDSAVELLIGEYEEAPENYGKSLPYDADEEDIAESHREILFGIERLSAIRGGAEFSAFRPMTTGQQWPHLGAHPRKGKRSYAESVGTSDEDYDSGVDSQGSGRRVRRGVTRRDGSVEAVSVGNRENPYPESHVSDYEVDMEM